ncbi:hypothetical protein [Candidatus Laterigemmans baculatus]|uniref:hypothetical protein n=1 Tax=Candidatus Laterigemmans baculatus TaxID=2770505 RepID=UPI0013DBE9E4|nr:hypothetical protein [Candidatus Laterigemmans baculatus]
MPSSFEGFGVRFLYPDNWKIVEQTEPGEESTAGVMLETPEKAFFSVNRYTGNVSPQKVVDQAIAAMQGEYQEIEVTPLEDETATPRDASAELSFYYLDLLVETRLLGIADRDEVLLVQIQGESRDFDRLEPVFQAMLQSLRESLG